MKHNKKTFWTLDRHHAEGFTLVELIVVIAILAILAGVAIPVYSGYIKKAERAADEQLLAAVNTAFAAACLQNGANHFALPETPEITLVDGTNGKKVKEVSLYNDDFFTFFAGNENAAFKTVTSNLIFNPETGMFELPGEDGDSTGPVKVTFGGVEFEISWEDAQKLTNSTFGQTIGSDALLDKVDSVSSIASGLLDGTGYSVIDKLIYGNDQDNPSEAYKENLAAQLGMHIDDLNGLLDDLEAENPGAKNQFLANSLVLTAAQKTEGLDTSFLGTTGFANQLKTDLDDPEKASDALAQAALAYGMYTAYANSSYGNDELKANINNMETSGGFGGLTTMLGGLEDENFKNYLASAEGQADLEAYQSAMNIINQSAGTSSDATVGILVNGFEDEELSNLLKDIMGN